MNRIRKALSWLYPVQIEKVRGQLNHELEVNVYNGKVVLDSSTVNYSYGTLQEVFDHAFTKTHLYDAPIKSALILGFGSGSVAELLLQKCDAEIKITGVEADAEVIRLAKQYFPVARNSNVSIVHADASEYVLNTTGPFDVIVVDVFIEDIVPASCQSEEFLQNVKSLLGKNGRLYFNKMRVDGDLIPIEKFEQNLRDVFGKFRNLKFQKGGGQNSVFVSGV